MDLKSLREQIDAVDDRLSALYLQRLALVDQVAAVKAESGTAVEHGDREAAILDRLTASAGKDGWEISALYQEIFRLSKLRQRRDLSPEVALPELVEFDDRAPGLVCACQGREGAWSQRAAGQLLNRPDIRFFPRFSQVFEAVSGGEAPFGVLPLENSTAGTVNEVYDLLRRHGCYIAGGVRLAVSHCLAALPGTKIEEVRRVISHEQALRQCRAFLSGQGWETLTAPNTALAARQVAERGERDLAVLASEEAAAANGLEILRHGVTDQSRNFTRFILIAARPLTTPRADRVSLALTLPHKKGQLCLILELIASCGINLCKLESRPLPERPFEFLFYFDLEGSLREEGMRELLKRLPLCCADWRFLGCYEEKES